MIWQQIWEFFTSPSSWTGSGSIPTRLGEHVGYTLIVVAVAIVLAFPVGALIGHTRKGSWLVINAANGARSLPTLGLLTLLVLLMGLGFLPAAIGLTILAIPPILTATYAGVKGADPVVVDAALGVGLSEWQVFWSVELPLGFPVILGGIRSAVLQVIATATVAAYIALGGLGRYILDGLAVRDYGQMAGGAILVAGLALLADLLFSLIGRAVTRWSRRDAQPIPLQIEMASAEAEPQLNPELQTTKKAVSN